MQLEYDALDPNPAPTGRAERTVRFIAGLRCLLGRPDLDHETYTSPLVLGCDSHVDV